jgi:hypothetical protein
VHCGCGDSSRRCPRTDARCSPRDHRLHDSAETIIAAASYSADGQEAMRNMIGISPAPARRRRAVADEDRAGRAVRRGDFVMRERQEHHGFADFRVGEADRQGSPASRRRSSDEHRFPPAPRRFDRTVSRTARRATINRNEAFIRHPDVFEERLPTEILHGSACGASVRAAERSRRTCDCLYSTRGLIIIDSAESRGRREGGRLLAVPGVGGGDYPQESVRDAPTGSESVSAAS